MERLMQRGSSKTASNEAGHGGIVNIAIKLGLGAVAILSCACSNKQRPAESAMTEPIVAEGTSATESIAEARCARESRCDNTGPDKKFSSMEDCIIRIREDWREELSARECPGGINETQLNECLDAIRAEECSSPFDTLERVAACTAAQICVN
jgi:hypothetical protein